MKVRKPSELTREQLAAVVEEIQQILWMDHRTEPPTWDADRPWDSETIEHIAAALTQAGLAPMDDTEEQDVE